MRGDRENRSPPGHPSRRVRSRALPRPVRGCAVNVVLRVPAGVGEEGNEPTAATPWRAILVTWAASRLLVLVAAVAAETLVTRNPRLTGGSAGPILTSLTSWDGWWYLGVARSGYHAAPLSGAYHDYAFFPLWPGLVRVLSFPWSALDGLVAVLLANALFLAALVLLYRLTADVLDADRALWSCVLLSLFPFAWVFSMAYGESLFLTLSLGSLLSAERGHAGRASLLAMLATTVRFPGVLLLVPLAILLWRRMRDRRRVVWLVVVPLGAAAFAGYVTALTGDAWAYLGAQAAWGRAGTSASSVSTGGSLVDQLDVLRASFLVTLLAYVFLLVYVRADRIPAAYAAIPVLTLAAVFATGNISSIGRLGMTAFPFAWILAGRRGRAARVALPALCGAVMAITGTLAFAGWYQP
jgi:hypothetical protein